MEQKIKNDIYNWIEKNYPRKFQENNNRDKIVNIIFHWLSVSVDDYQLNFNTSNEWKLLNEYFSKPEFFPLLNIDTDEDTKIVYQRFNYTPILLSLSETTPGKFKYIIIKNNTPLPTIIMKCKFEVQSDGRIHDLTKNRTFDNYDEMKRYIIENEIYIYHFVSDPRENNLRLHKDKITSKITEKKLYTKQILSYFDPLKQNEFILNDGKIHFSLDLFTSWSSTISNMLFEQEDMTTSDSEIILNTNKKIFIIYVLLRLSNFFEYKIPIDILYSLSIDKLFNIELIIDNIFELYLFCDYLEDNISLSRLIDLFRENVVDKYQRQKFYDILFLHHTI